MKINLIYASFHHKNTEKVMLELGKVLEREHEVFLYDMTKGVKETGEADFTVIASGIYYRNVHKNLLQYIEQIKTEGNSPVYLFYTGGKISEKFLDTLSSKLLEKGYNIAGKSGILGYDTYGPLKLIGGIHKECPTKEDIYSLIEDIKTSIADFEEL